MSLSSVSDDSDISIATLNFRKCRNFSFGTMSLLFNMQTPEYNMNNLNSDAFQYGSSESGRIFPLNSTGMNLVLCSNFRTKSWILAPDSFAFRVDWVNSFDLNQWCKPWFKSSNKIKSDQRKKSEAVWNLCVISVTRLINILIGFHLCLYRRQRVSEKQLIVIPLCFSSEGEKVSGCDFFPLFFGHELKFLEGSYTKKM